MTLTEQRLAVGIILAIVILIRLASHREAGGIGRDQSDGMEREGGVVLSILLRLVFLVGGLGSVLIWLSTDGVLPGQLDPPAPLPWLGLISAVAGTGLLVWVQLALGVHFSGTLHLRDDHRLVQRGPYEHVRHPMYTSFVLLFVGLALLTGNALIGAVLVGSQVWTIGVRLRHEEGQLREAFGSTWDTYRATTGALVPKLRRPARRAA
ncbi:MAG: isoprenylcysteine carboxylmethyltransferase family protein [Actinomycetota bacterium]